METLKENYSKVLNEAKKLPTHVNGVLQDHYKYFGEKKAFTKVMYHDQADPVSVFEALNIRYSGATRFYVKNIPTYREDGNLNKMRDWKKILMFHKAWSRNDIEVKDVNFEIVGIKRQTTNLPAGVLISNAEFVL
jgi:hypothetical protein